MCALVATSLAATIHEYPADTLQTVACRVQDGKVVLGEWFDPGDAKGFAMEAEDAVDLVADPVGGVEDATCSGGRYVVKLDRALFPINVTTPGRYQRWSRAFFPQGGGWLHSESMDLGPQTWLTDCDGSTAGRWVWVKGPVYDLTVGPHLLWIHNWHGGARLDKVVLLPEGSLEPDGLGPASLKRSQARAGFVLTPLITVPGLKSLDHVEWPFDARQGEVRLSASVDGGAHFMPLAQLSAASYAGLAAPKLQLRADVRAATDGTSPVLDTPRLSYTVDPGAFATLEDDAVRATFLKATGALVGLFDKKAGVECVIGADAEAPPFELRLLTKGATEPQPIPAASIKLTSLNLAPARLMAKYLTDGDVVANLTVDLHGGELSFALDVDNRSPVDVVEVMCPSLPGVRLGDRGEDDLLITPDGWGGTEITDPVRAGGGSVPYPCGGSMAWLDLYERTPGHGLYLTSHDPTLLGCRLEAASRPDTGTLTFGIVRYAHVRSGKRWTAPAAIVGVHGGDWHAAADAYRTWARTWLHRPEPPEWVREADGWYGLVVSADGAHIPFRQIPDYLKPMRELGTNYIQVWGQMTGGVNCDALPYPNPVLGTIDEFKAAIREVRRWGAHITFYVSSQFWRVDYGDASMLGSTPRSMLPPTVPTWDWSDWRDYAIRSYSGAFSGDTPLSAEDAKKYGTPWLRTVMCPFTDAWANRHLKYWTVSQYADQYGASGIYLDETASAAERVCFASNHGHEHQGIWGSSLTRDMKAMVTEGRRHDPDWMFAMEACSDALGQYADVNLISPASARADGVWGAARHYVPEVFHYTFPEYLLYNGTANGLYGKSEDDCLLDAHLLGNRYDVFSTQPAGRYLALRRCTKQLLYRARFMDSVGVFSRDPAVRVKNNVLQDERNDVRLINIANPMGKEGASVVVLLGKAADASAYYFDLDGKEGPLPLVVTQAGVEFLAPTSRASTVVIATTCEPIVRVPVTTTVAGEAGALRVTVTNVTRHALSGKLAMDGGDGQTVAVTVQPQSSVDATVPLPSRPTLFRGCVSGHVVLTAASGTVRRPFEALVVSPFSATAALRRSSVHVTVSNAGKASRTGTIAVSGMPWPAPIKRPLSVEAGASAEYDLPVTGPIVEPTTLDVAITIGGETEHQSATIRPVLLNGGFERLGEGGRPSEWEYQQSQQASADTTNPASGKTCLKLTHAPGLFVEAHQFLSVEAGHAYTARCKLRRTPGTAATIGPIIVFFPKSGGERSIALSKLTNLPDDQWNDYTADFTVADDVARTALYLYDVNSDADVWFDDASIE
jgi:hypothetical protein